MRKNNQPVESEIIGDGDGVKVVKFQRTPIMSTYLVAVVVGDFDYVEDKTTDGILVRVYSPPGKKEQGRFALHCATKILPFYKEYFGIAYPLPKMDLIAIAELSAGMNADLFNIYNKLCSEHVCFFYRCNGKLGIGYVQRKCSIG